MAGTDHGQDSGWDGPTPAFILVRPQMGENIGAAARAMLNFGCDRMRLVAPRDGWPNSAAVATASGAARVLDHVQVSDTVEEATGDLNYVFATTARDRDLTKPVMTPERAMQHARELTAAGQKVGIMFGPERAGLENSDIVRANALVSVPVNPAFASLNLAQCVLLTAYEWRRSGDDTAPEVMEMAKTRFAEAIELQKLLEGLEARLDAVGFFFPEHKRDSMVENLRNMVSRMNLTEADVRTLHGVFRALAEKRKGFK
ncbi:RNA methyltransferase [Oceanomicrobium pacificus]|uniref:tRNA (cytidine/uridine-2'-O-)-methyltransferase TrmJ n=1 Tax=Oceanomicrobium pacificus TaxID=2692916 RepID=A0A6B0U5V4_9RHOB|nr:RNA methyltransferase [Oceanomicrobium pacificus]MXU66281.1 TrmJ/YjtD family RNA methyltransferase [Oceanomicrobium pacificus]